MLGATFLIRERGGETPFVAKVRLDRREWGRGRSKRERRGGETRTRYVHFCRYPTSRQNVVSNIQCLLTFLLLWRPFVIRKNNEKNHNYVFSNVTSGQFKGEVRRSVSFERRDSPFTRILMPSASIGQDVSMGSREQGELAAKVPMTRGPVHYLFLALVICPQK